MITPTDEYDSPWKETIEAYFQECLEFFFPEVANDIDWSKKYTFLDKELQKIVARWVFREEICRQTGKSLAKKWERANGC